MTLLECVPDGLYDSGDCYGPSRPRVVVTDFEGLKKPLVIYDEQDWDFTEGLEPVEVPSGWLEGFEFTATQYIHPKLKHQLFDNDGLKIWSVYDEKQPDLGFVAFDEEVLACFLAAWDHRGQERHHATEERIGLRNGQLFWIPEWYPLRDNFGSFKFDLVLKHHEAEALLEMLKESVNSFWTSSESRKWKRGLFFGSFSMQLHQLPKHVVCVQLIGIECTIERSPRRRMSSPRSPTTPVFSPDEVMIMNLHTLTDIEKWVLCDVSPLEMDSESE